ncbi:MAG: hypothetical protein Q9O62_06420 [Ardenticatenia bacterium]|nr:hypothetical protein [Ardenticatenia bacterium]
MPDPLAQALAERGLQLAPTTLEALHEQAPETYSQLLEAFSASPALSELIAQANQQKRKLKPQELVEAIQQPPSVDNALNNLQNLRLYTDEEGRVYVITDTRLQAMLESLEYITLPETLRSMGEFLQSVFGEPVDFYGQKREAELTGRRVVVFSGELVFAVDPQSEEWMDTLILAKGQLFFSISIWIR